MSSIPIDIAAAKAAIKGRESWLSAAKSSAGRDVKAAGIFTFADALTAIGFAGGLSMALTALPKGVALAIPGAAVAISSGAARGFLAYAAASAGAKAAAGVKDDIRGRLVRAALRARPGERTTTGASMALVAEGVEALDGYYARFLPAKTAAAAAPLLIIAAMALASPVSAAIALITFIPFIFSMALVGGAAAEEARRQFQALSRLSGLFADRVRGLPAVLAFQAEERTTDGIADAADDLSYRTLKVLKVAFLSSGALEFFAALSVALVAVYCGFNLLRLLPFPSPERLDLSRAFFVLALAPEVYLPMRRLAAAYHDRQAADAVVDSLAALEQTPARAPAVAQAHAAIAPIVIFNQVSVIYADNDAQPLQNFDLRIGPGEIVALVGPTGCGKSTVLNLLLGLVEPASGSVAIGGFTVQDSPTAIAWAGQSPIVAPGSLADNIALAKQNATPDELRRAAVMAGLLGAGELDRRIDERGGGLSGGERRRLGLARAFLRNAPLMLLDEPTANLDAASEAALLPVLAAAARGRTTLIATHSAAVAAIADRVIQLAGS
jgi:ATP-binding cassette subfamily C protein CydD